MCLLRDQNIKIHMLLFFRSIANSETITDSQLIILIVSIIRMDN